MLQKIVAPLFTSLLVATPALAATYSHLDPARCVDPSGMKKCVEKVDAEQPNCVKTVCPDREKECLPDTCLCAGSISQMDCALTHCWDQAKKQVYSCEYQETVEWVLKTCDEQPEEGFPFYPAPVDAPNSCSCNKAKVVETVGKVLEEQNDCEGGASDAWERLSPAELKAKVAPACCKFDNGTCHTEYNYTLPGNNDAKFYEPGEFPKNGTHTTMTNLAGTITSPISGATFTWTMNSTAHTIIAASVHTTAASASTTASSENTTPKSTDAQATESSNETEDKGNNASAVVPRTWSIMWPGLIFFVI
ncbi:uncharacterized protein NECHADRAFT_49773 [Fusarium vanettenii 77-13-4]|uniref:Extracellular membrane protein CFEM domain-containing protein n=1 Tax=Fusarium vanettenii (strain ATCC MYA-4622 / CBS 123669 / FGSC 9596 / NRRL 45880 / 77-13-4) TaxID=660122 RepID=C7ZJ48_FUSV7|nr:uncharacterized protein NECHADRAFT_49773 [Fusarium vanettenii 77-13-4]EEU36014.1 hypothetical protein NECHADRAFT_49773 [Fusarium vanettenii 77-13-4]